MRIQNSLMVQRHSTILIIIFQSKRSNYTSLVLTITFDPRGYISLVITQLHMTRSFTEHYNKYPVFHYAFSNN